MSCSKVFNSKYGKGFGIVALVTGDDNHPLNQPNALYGIVFYSLFGLLYFCSGNSKFLANLQFYSFVLAIFEEKATISNGLLWQFWPYLALI